MIQIKNKGNIKKKILKVNTKEDILFNKILISI